MPRSIALAALLCACDARVLSATTEAPPADPEAHDSDGDGWLDDEERSLGTDPDWRFSWAFGGERWPDFLDEAAAAGLAAEGYGLGQVVPDFVGRDQHGNRVRLSTFYGYVVLVDFVAAWCDPCVAVAREAEAMWETHRLDGFLVVHVVIDDVVNDGGLVEPSFAATWAAAHGLEFPVLVDPDRAAITGFEASGLSDGAIPFMALLDAEMRIDGTYVGQGAQLDAEVRAVELLPTE